MARKRSPADLDISRIVMCRPCDQCLNASAFGLRRHQRRAYNFVSARKSHLAARHLAYFRRQPVIDFISNHEEAEQRAIGSGTAVDRLDKCLVEVMVAQPPMARFSALLIERLLEIFFGCLFCEPRCLGMHSDDLTFAVDHDKQIASRDWEMSCDASWIVTGSGLVMMARVIGRSASKATSLVSIVSRS